MTTDLGSLLREEVLREEPAFTLSSAPAVRSGRHVLRRRRLTGGLGLAVLLLTVGAPLLPGDAVGSAEMPPAAEEVLGRFDPETFPEQLDTEIRRLAGDSLPVAAESLVEPTLDGGTRLRPRDYVYTDAWTAWYEISSTDRLMVILRHDRSANEGDADRYCVQNLRDGALERCAASTLEDGTVAIASVHAVRRGRDGYSSARPDDPPAARWFVRQVVNRRDYGFGVIAREYVQASTLAEADARWTLDLDTLTRISASPRLVYELPDSDRRECDPTYLIPEKEMGLATVRCDL
jgi:hypothetical protein